MESVMICESCYAGECNTCVKLDGLECICKCEPILCICGLFADDKGRCSRCGYDARLEGC